MKKWTWWDDINSLRWRPECGVPTTEATKRIPCRLCSATVLVPKASIAEKGYCISCGDRLRVELQQYAEVAGLSPIDYPNGRRLPDANLHQDQAFLAHILDGVERKNALLRLGLTRIIQNKIGHPTVLREIAEQVLLNAGYDLPEESAWRKSAMKKPIDS